MSLLQLRQEFKTVRATAIELSNRQNTGSIQSIGTATVPLVTKSLTNAF
jgi:hypothetical protein